MPIWKNRGNFALVAGLAIAAVAGLVVIAVVLATAGGQPDKQTAVVGSTAKAVPTLTPQANNALNLTYPGAKTLPLTRTTPGRSQNLTWHRGFR